MKRFVLKPSMIIPGLLVGAACGAGLFVAALLAVAAVQGSISEAPAITPSGVIFGVALIFALTFFIYLAGLVLIGLPAWAVAHACGARSWPAAMLLGAVLNTCAVLALASNTPKPALWTASLFGGLGAFVGWVFWRTAYRLAPDAGGPA